jgi:hypothetical protein
LARKIDPEGKRTIGVITKVRKKIKNLNNNKKIFIYKKINKFLKNK